MPVAKTFKQSDSEQQKIKQQLDTAMLPSVLDWPASIDMLGAYMRAHYVDENGVLDCSFGNTWASIKAMKDSLIWVVAPRKSSQSKIFQDERSGRVVRDLRSEREERNRAAFEDDKDRAARGKTLEQKYEEANRQGRINIAWAGCREFVSTYQGGRTYGERARHKDALTQILKSYQQNPNGNPADCMQALQNKIRALQDAPMFG